MSINDSSLSSSSLALEHGRGDGTESGRGRGSYQQVSNMQLVGKGHHLHDLSQQSLTLG